VQEIRDFGAKIKWKIEKQKETHEKVAGYTEEIKEKEKEIGRLGSEIEGINKRIEIQKVFYGSLFMLSRT